MNWYNVEIRKDDPTEKTLRVFCDNNGIYYDPSDAGFGYTHFEIECNRETADRIEKEVLN